MRCTPRSKIALLSARLASIVKGNSTTSEKTRMQRAEVTCRIKKKRPDQSRAAPVFRITLAKWLLAIGVLGSLLFAHGCHGSEDHELFGNFTAWIIRE